MRSRGSGRGTFGRFLLYQVPGWMVAGLCALLALRWELLSLPMATLLLAAYVVKDFALYPLTRRAYEEQSPEGPGVRELVGARGVALEALAPEGYVRIGSESWRARLAPGGAGARAGAQVEVRAVEGLTLVVATVAEDGAAMPPEPGSA